MSVHDTIGVTFQVLVGVALWGFIIYAIVSPFEKKAKRD